MANFNVIDINDTALVGGTNLIPVVGHELVAYDRASVPLQTMMMNLKRVRQTGNPTYFWYETQYDDPSTTCEGIASETAGTQQTVVFDSLNVRAGDRYLEPTTDQLFLTKSITGYNSPSAGKTTAVIVRVPSTEATTAVAGTPLMIRIDNQMLEGDYYPEAVTNLPTKLTNGISVIADALAVTTLMNDTPSFYNQGSEFDFQRTATIERFRKQMERTIIWSQFYQEQQTHSHNGNSWTNTAYSTNGIINSIDTDNVIPYSGSVTESGLDGFLANTVWSTRYYGSDFKVGFAGPQVFNDVMGFAKNRTLTGTGVTNMTYGLNVTTYIAYGGQKLYMILEREFMNDNPAYSHSLVVIDPLHVQLMYHGSALMMVKNTTPPNQAVMSIGLESRPGVLLDFAKAHAIYQQGS